MRRALLILLVACGPGPTLTKQEPVVVKPTVPVEVVPASDPTPPELRLPTTARPIRNQVELTLDPATEDFTGTIEIELEVTAPTSVLWLNAEEISSTASPTRRARRCST